MLTTKGNNYKEYACLSTDDKPIAAANGSILIEIDTFKIYSFDEGNKEWIEITAAPEEDEEEE